MLLRATLLQAFCSGRSERQLIGQIDDSLLFRWFAGLPINAANWHPTVFSHNRDRLMAADVAREFLAAQVGLAPVKTLLSSDHFAVDGTLIVAWASVQPKDGSGPPLGNGLAVETTLTQGTGTAERKATLVMLDPRKPMHPALSVPTRPMM